MRQDSKVPPQKDMMQMPEADDQVNPSFLGQMHPAHHDELGIALHDTAIHGYKRKLKKILAKGIEVDYPNAAGQTALFCACFEGQESVIGVLLQHGANPNARCDVGSTPMHAAGYSCNPKILACLIEAGGDMRLHDSKGRTVRYWAICNPDHKKRRKVIEYIEKTRYFALTYTGRDILQKQSSQHLTLQADRSRSSVTTSLMNLLKYKGLPQRGLFSSSVHSFGYGKVYFGNGEYLGSVATVPLVPEAALKHDEYAPNYFNGPFMVMEGMRWNKTLVTVKRLHKQPAGDSTVDLLIRENDHMARLRHPNILLLMGLCQTNNLEGLVLIYERVGCGSLFHCLHQKSELLSRFSMCELLLQVSDALLYIHQQNLLHCTITSHAVQLISSSVAKLSNFEYMVEKDVTDYPCGNEPCEVLSSRSFSVVEEQVQHGPYNWLAPEILSGAGPTEKSDLYSLCAVMWEIIHGNIPWGELVGTQIKAELVEHKNVLKVSDKVKNPFNVLLHYGLSSDPEDRNLTVEQFRDIMSQIVMDHERSSVSHENNSPRTSKTQAYKSYKSWKAPKTATANIETLPTTMTTTATVEDDAGLSDSEEKENPFIDFIGADYAANAATTTPQSSKTKTVARISKTTISKTTMGSALSSRVTLKSSGGDPLWREKIDIIRQSQIPSGGFIRVVNESTDDRDGTPVPAPMTTRTLAGTVSAAAGGARRRTNLSHIRDELERSKRSFFDQSITETWPSTSSLPQPKRATGAASEPRAAKKETAGSVGRMPSVNENNNGSHLANKSLPSMNASDLEANPFKQYHTENVIAEIKAVLSTRPLNKYKSTCTFLPSSLGRPRRSFGGSNELLKRTVFGALSNPVTTYLRSQKSTTGTTSHTENEGTTVTTTKTTRIMRSHITPLSRFSVTPSSRGSAAIAGNTSDFNRSSWNGSWTLSFDANDDHSCKPASHCLLRESTPINTKDSNTLPKPHDFAWPQSEQSTATEHVTSPVTHWSRSKTTSLSPAIKKALSYHGATQQQTKLSVETGRSSPDNQAPIPEAEPGDVGEGHHRKRSSPPPVHTKESKSGYGGIRDLIRKFQGHVEERLHKQPSQSSGRRSHEKYPATGVVAAKSTPAVRTRDYSAFYSTEYRRPTPIVGTTTSSSTSYLQKIMRKSSDRLSGILRAQRNGSNAAESIPAHLENSPTPPARPPPARPPPPRPHDSSYLSTSSDQSDVTPSDDIGLTTDESEDVSLLVDKVIHDAHKMLTVEARTSNERPDKMSQLARGNADVLATALPTLTSPPVITPNYAVPVTSSSDNRPTVVTTTNMAVHRSTVPWQQRPPASITVTMSNLGTQTAGGSQSTGAGYFSATVKSTGVCKHCRTQRFSNVNKQAGRRAAAVAMGYEGEEVYSTPPAEMASRRSEAELEDLYFDDELCNENLCRQRHLRLESPLTDTLSMLPGGATCCPPTVSVGTTCDCVNQQSDLSARQSAIEPDVKLEKAVGEESRSILPPLMEADSDESESLRKVLDPSNDVGYYATVRVDSFDKSSPVTDSSKGSNRFMTMSGDAACLSPGDQSDQTGDSNTDDAVDT